MEFRRGRQELFFAESKYKKQILAGTAALLGVLHFPATTYSLLAYLMPEWRNPEYTVVTEDGDKTMSESEIESAIGIELKGYLDDGIVSRIRHVQEIIEADGVDLGKSVKTIVVFPNELRRNYAGLAPTRHTLFLSNDLTEGNIIHEFAHCHKYTLSDMVQAEWDSLSEGSYRHDGFYLSYVKEQFEETSCSACLENAMPSHYASLNKEEDYAELIKFAYCNRGSLKIAFSNPKVNKELYAKKFAFAFREKGISQKRYDLMMDLLWEEPKLKKSDGSVPRKHDGTGSWFSALTSAQ